ncbi:hypothetical protein [Pacificibacter marinus]|uniref:Uncharacterized protein n=1 Tax=Pacificibacter marinus TaxID=658057 RepID=A0A1Y5SIG2_9RHOB|nr:hypothetical protein [Pacificibacter marinus]SEK52682.1 hypothetical protein SAMN04488032_103177 [Pacificibacter marinus]SLN38570.1 hypothetical protein PAM7971_01729 [Pacificibacter marinus]
MTNTISHPDSTILKKATDDAATNWEWWEDDYLYKGDFGALPILQTFSRFRGFGADYSVTRGLNSRECDEMRKWLTTFVPATELGRDQDEFNAQFVGFHEKCKVIEDNIRNELTTQKRVSLFSKLLGHWKPNEFAMWDQYARIGLRRIVGGNHYTQYKHYCRFNTDFHNLKRAWSGELSKISEERWASQTSDKDKIQERIELFMPRILDNYLVELGRS